MAFNLGNFLKGVGRQVNVFDQGRTFSHPAPQKPAPRQAPPPPRVNVQQLTQAMQNHALNQPVRLGQVQIHAAPQITAPPQPNVITHNPLTNAIGNVLVKPAVHTAVQTGNTLRAAGAGTGGLARASVGALTHNPIAEHHAIQQTNQALANLEKPGRSFLTPQAVNQGGTQIIKPTITAATQIAPYVVSPFIGKGAGVAERLIKPAATFGTVNAGSTAAQEGLQGKVNPGDVAKSFVMGAGAGLVGGGLGIAARGGGRVAIKATNEYKPLNEVGGGKPFAGGKPDPKLDAYNQAVKQQGGLAKSLPKGISPKDVKQTHVFGSSIVKGSTPHDVDVALTLPAEHPALHGLPFDPGRTQVGKIHYSYFADNELGQMARDKFINTGRKGAQPAVKVPAQPTQVAKLPAKGSEVVTVGGKQYLKDIYQPNDKRIAVQSKTKAFKIGKSRSEVVTKEEAQAGRAQGMTPKAVALRKALIKDSVVARNPQAEKMAQNPMEPITLPDPAGATNALKVKDAIKTADAHAAQFIQPATLVANQMDKVLGKSIKNRDLFYQAIEHPERADDIAKQFGKQAKDFTNLVAANRSLTNVEDAAYAGTGVKRGYIGGNDTGYVHHSVDLSTPEARATYATLKNSLIKGGSAQQRMYTTEQLKDAGLKLKNMSAGDALRDWAGRQGKILRDNALFRQARKIDPDLISARGGSSPNFFSGNKEIRTALKGVQPYDMGKTMRAMNAVNTALKQVSLLGGGFHDLKTSLREFWQEAFSGRNPIKPLIEGNKQHYSTVLHDQWISKNSAWNRIWADAGVANSNISEDLRGNIEELTHGRLEKFNPYMKGLFERKLDYFKKQTVMSELEKRGITPKNYDPANAAMRKTVQDLGDQSRNWYQGLSWRSMGVSPVMQQVLRFLTLAPDFTLGKLRSLNYALNPKSVGFKSAAGSLARKQVISEAVGLAILAEVGNKAVSGKFVNPAQAALNPQIPTNMKDSKGRALKIGLPGSEVADVYRAATDPAHFAQSHAAALPSKAIQASVGKDYYGNPLVDPFKNPNPNFGQNLAGALKGSATIPGVQISKTLSGKQNVQTGILNTLGFRVGLDTTTQQYKDTKNFFDTQSKFVKGLNPNEKSLYNAVNPTKKDASGQPVYDPSIFNKSGTYNLLADNPKFTDKYQAYQKSQKNHDPLWDLPKNQLQDVLLLRGGRTYPGQTYTKAGASLSQATGADQPWYQAFLNKEQAFFAKLPKTATTTAKLDYGPQPNPYVQRQLNAKNYKDPQVQAYFSSRDVYTNSQRQQQGLEAIAPFGQVGVAGQLDNPAQLAITPKGSSYGTGAPKVKTASAKSSTGSSGGSTGRTRTAKVATLKVKLPPKPKQVKVGKAPSTSARNIGFKAPKLAKARKSKIRLA